MVCCLEALPCVAGRRVRWCGHLVMHATTRRKPAKSNTSESWWLPNWSMWWLVFSTRKCPSRTRHGCAVPHPPHIEEPERRSAMLRRAVTCLSVLACGMGCLRPGTCAVQAKICGVDAPTKELVMHASPSLATLMGTADHSFVSGSAAAGCLWPARACKTGRPHARIAVPAPARQAQPRRAVRAGAARSRQREVRRRLAT